MRFRDEEVTEGLHARNIFELFRIDEIALKRGRLKLREDLHEARIFIDQIIRQHRNPRTTCGGVIEA